MNIRHEEHERRQQLHRNFLSEKGNDVLGIPYNRSLIKDEATDKEEHGHPYLGKIIVQGNALVGRTQAESDNMTENDEQHGKTS